MINLLPPEEKQKLISQKRERLTAVLGTVILISLVCLILILLSIKFYILAATDYQRNALEQAERKYKTQDFVVMTNTIEKYNTILAQLSSFYEKEIYFSKVLEIITNIPSDKNLLITNFSLSRDESGTVKVSISGISNTRENLLAFKNSVELEEKIKKPYFSPESWTAPKNAPFSLTFEIN